jgi:hypothetical protein
MSRTVKQVANTVRNVLDQTIGKVPDIVADPKGFVEDTLGQIHKVQPLKAAGRYVEDTVHAGLDILGAHSRDVGAVWGSGGITEKQIEDFKKMPLHQLMGRKARSNVTLIPGFFGEKEFEGLNIEDVGLFRKLGGEFAQQQKLHSDVGSLVPQERTVTASTAMKKLYDVNKTRQDAGGEMSQVEKELMGLARMYSGRQQAIKSSRRRPGQRESLLTRR